MPYLQRWLFAMAVALLGSFLAIYVFRPPYNEVALIRGGNRRCGCLSYCRLCDADCSFCCGQSAVFCNAGLGCRCRFVQLLTYMAARLA